MVQNDVERWTEVAAYVAVCDALVGRRQTPPKCNTRLWKRESSIAHLVTY